MKATKATKEIKVLFEKADKIATKEMIRIARYIMANNSKIDFFIIAMGTYFFTDTDGETIYNRNLTGKPDDFRQSGYKRLDNFIAEFDKTFHLTGTGVAFTATSQLIEDWITSDDIARQIKQGYNDSCEFIK